MLLSLPLILLTLSVLSYGIAIISVGETIIFTIFKKIMDNENILLLNNEIDMDDTIDEINDLDRSSHRILSFERNKDNYSYKSLNLVILK